MSSSPTIGKSLALAAIVAILATAALLLTVQPANSYAGGRGAPAAAGPAEAQYILTPKAPATPRINGAKIFGVRPGHPFLFTVAATGDRPMKYEADKLPAGLSINADTGVITGVTKEKGEYTATVRAINALGRSERALKIVVGDRISLTPPLGWNSWNVFAQNVSVERVKAAADAMVKSGLINHGWTYINIDDFWEMNNGARGPADLKGDARKPDGTINTNPRFPDMKGLVDYIHGLGLKAGIYSSPGTTTCGGCTGSYQHEEQDAKTWADWGFDYLKYDVCFTYRVPDGLTGRPAAMRPYQDMRKALDKVDRDIHFSLCQYGNQNVWEWGGEIGGNSWRVTGDITDTWQSMTGILDNRNGWASAASKWVKPGNWNDPDMLIVGVLGWGNTHPSRLTPSEQYSHISLWSLVCSPLLIGCDMTKFDDFTLNLLTNDEVLDVSQDPLGKPATRIVAANGFEVWAKDMSDGSKAVGIFNRNDAESKYSPQFADLKLAGKQTVRDLWRQQDVGSFDTEFEATVARHGTMLVKISPAK